MGITIKSEQGIVAFYIALYDYIIHKSPTNELFGRLAIHRMCKPEDDIFNPDSIVLDSLVPRRGGGEEKDCLI